MSNKIQLTCLILLISIFPLGYYFLVDDELDSEVTAIINDWNTPIKAEDNALICMIGLTNEPNISPCEHGLKLYNQEKSHTARLNRYPIIDNSIDDKILDNPLLCMIHDNDCISYIQLHQADARIMVDKYQLLLDRFNALQQHKNFDYLRLDSTHLDFTSLTVINELSSLDILLDIWSENFKQAEQKLLNLLRTDRDLALESQSLILKIVYIVRLQETYPKLIHQLASHHKLNHKKFIAALQPLKIEDLSMETFFKRNFASNFNSIGGSISEHPLNEKIYGRALLHLFYKENKTTNAIFEVTKKFYPASTSYTKKEFFEKHIEAVNITNNLKVHDEFNLNNIIGDSLLKAIGPPMFINLTDDFIKADLHLLLIRLKYLTPNIENAYQLSDDNFSNPYTNLEPFIKDNKYCYKLDEENICV